MVTPNTTPDEELSRRNRRIIVRRGRNMRPIRPRRLPNGTEVVDAVRPGRRPGNGAGVPGGGGPNLPGGRRPRVPGRRPRPRVPGGGGGRRPGVAPGGSRTEESGRRPGLLRRIAAAVARAGARAARNRREARANRRNRRG